MPPQQRKFPTRGSFGDERLSAKQHTAVWPQTIGRNGVVVPGRVEIDNVQPVVSCGRYPAKAVVGEVVPVSAEAWRARHDAVAATLVVRYLGLRYPQATETRRITAVQAPEKLASAPQTSPVERVQPLGPAMEEGLGRSG